MPQSADMPLLPLWLVHF